jgi:8-oxo-dGTP pyrophosphatase MutT (NUDIX family)
VPLGATTRLVGTVVLGGCSGPSVAKGWGDRHHDGVPDEFVPRLEKVVAYIVRGRTVAVFLHGSDANPVRESGLQVPAGTCEMGETPEQAVLREAYEETGLKGLHIVHHLGEADYDMRPYTHAVHHRYFFHLAFDGPIVEEWRHIERDGGTGQPKPFLFSWLPIAQGHVLAAGLGAMLGRITPTDTQDPLN